MFGSASYKEKIWTQHELRSAVLRSLELKQEFLLPVRVGNVDIPEISKSIGWLDLESLSPVQLSTLIIEKLSKLAGSAVKSSQKSGQRKQSDANIVKRRLAMKKKIERDFLEKSANPKEPRTTRERILGTEMILHDVTDTLYPDFDPKAVPSGWMKLEIFDLYFGGVEAIVDGTGGLIDSNGNWMTIKSDPEAHSGDLRAITVWAIGRIPYDCIVDYDMTADDYYHGPHVYCHYWNNRSPWECFRFVYTDEKTDFRHAKILIPYQRHFSQDGSRWFDSDKNLILS